MADKKMTAEQALARINSIMRGVASPKMVQQELKARKKKMYGGKATTPAKKKMTYGGKAKKK